MKIPVINSDILNNLTRDSGELIDAHNDFGKWRERRLTSNNQVRITCFYEEHETPGVGMVVTEASAAIPPCGMWGIPATHSDMSKFAGRDDRGYRKIMGELQRWIKDLINERRKTSDSISQSSIGHRNELDILDRLPIAVEATFNSRTKEQEPLCLQNTRVTVLEEINTWANGDSGQCIFWLCGMAGTGKSTIARTAAHSFSQLGHLGASFFFSRGGKDVRNADKFLPTIAKQLAVRFPAIRGYICDVLEKQRDIFQETRRNQWGKLVKEPLSKYAGPAATTLVIVLDALDECEGDDDIRSIIQLLADATDIKSIRLRILLTSRPETPIRLGFRKMGAGLHHDFVLHEISQAVVDKDMALYFRHEFEKIRDDGEYLDEDWPGEKVIDALVQNAGGLFIYAATVCRFINTHKEHWSPQGLLEAFLPNQQSGDAPNQRYEITSQSPTFELDSLYQRVLVHSMKGVIDQDKEKLSKEFRKIIGSIVVLSEPFTPTTLEKFLTVPKGTVYRKLRHLHSVLRVPDDDSQTIRLLHSSFRDFLLDKRRCHDLAFWIDEKQVHKDLATGSISLMKTSLKRDICSVHAPGTVVSDISQSHIEQCLPPEVQYACLHWIRHIHDGGDPIVNDGYIHAFLKKHYLHWLEALALLQKTAEGALAISELETLLESQRREYVEDANVSNAEIYLFTHDARRFTFFNQPIIRKAPLQVYCSALLFAPEMSIIKREFGNQRPPWFDTSPSTDTHWGSLQQIFEGHSDRVSFIAFSPDGSKLISGSDGIIRVWEVATGKLHQTLEGHFGSIRGMTFLSDYKVISGTSDGIVMVWDVATGKPLQTIKGHSASVGSLAFSSNGIVASGLFTGILQVWELTTGKLRHVIDGHFKYITSVAFSPDDNKIVSGSDDGTVRIWDVTTGHRIQAFSHSSSINDVAFSPNSDIVASGSLGKTAQMWEVATEKLQILEGHTAWVSSVKFFSDGKRIATGGSDDTVRIWDVATGKLQQTISYPSFIRVIALSPSCGQLATISSDNSVRISEVAMARSEPKSPLVHSRYVESVAFSSNGSKIVSGSRDRTARIWDTRTGRLERALRHPNSVPCAAFSPNDSQIVSGCGDCKVRIWDVATGNLLQTMKGYFVVRGVAFSPDGSKVISGTEEGTVRVWEVVTGKLLRTLKGHSRQVFKVFFSPDGSKILSGSSDCTVRVWEEATGNLQTLIDTGKLSQNVYGYSALISNIAFLPNCNKAMLGFDDYTIQVWDLATGIRLEDLEGHPASIRNADDGTPTYSIDKSNQWITRNGLRVLYIPIDLRPVAIAIHGSSVVMGAESGRVTILTFRPNLDGTIL
ncbi:hypothetical protein FQN49_007191 [Arthroderma sp. PD_2]|nr:hypothetical protein FQN49_007191 [Arthroderma sp. PD_2]